MDHIWIFNGANSRFASGVFTTRALAEGWIATNKLSGVLTKYPLDCGEYEWTIESGVFHANKAAEESSEFIGRFTTAAQEHYHYEVDRSAGL